MKRDVEQIIFYPDLEPEKAAEVRRKLSGEPEGMKLLTQWLRVRKAIAARVATATFDHDLFILCALSESGRAEALSPTERRRVQEESAEFAATIADHPGLHGVARDIGDAAAEFEAAWDARFERDHEPAMRRATVPDRRPRRRNGRGRWAVRSAIGAAVVLFAVILTLVIRREQGMITVETAPDEVRVISLADGSSVRLLGGSRLSYVPAENAGPLSGRAELEGRGFFEITAADRGFVVTTPNAQSTVLGTSFSVRSTRSETEVVLAEGSLSLASRRSPEQVVMLKPGQMSTVTDSRPPVPPVDIRVHEHLAWTGLFVFNSTPLDEILLELAGHYGAELSAAPELVSERVTGRFERDRPLLEILKTVAAAVGATVESTAEKGYRLVLR